MLSRVADNLYWMSRYLERAEHTVRLLRVNLSLMLDESVPHADRRWKRVLAAMGNPAGISWSDDADALADEMTFSAETAGSVTACIVAARENARHVREQISSEQWQSLNQLFLRVTRPNLEESADMQLVSFLASVLEGAHLFQGVTDSTMIHGEGWHFIEMGRYVERACATVKLLEVYHREFWNQPESPTLANPWVEWIGLLRSCTAFEAYCKVYTADISPGRILEFLLLNPDFPHSVRYCVDRLQRSLEATHGEDALKRAADLTRLAGRMQAALSFVQIGEILGQDACAYLQSIYSQCRQIHQTMFEVYVDYPVQVALTA